ncbi:GNAT family N-acetyltransferase [Actinorhabdospora filicis]|nr:GNAT family N-acetyltransferase [Actinorhabdospora filicis]
MMTLRRYAEGDFWLLEAKNTPEMTAKLGGPETPEKLADRHRRYTDPDGFAGGGGMFVVLDGGEPVGTVGYWVREWHGEPVYEAGWGVLPTHQGKGYATSAAKLAVEHAREHGDRAWLHAYPKVDHPASNAICRKAGFELMGECDFEYPVGNPIVCNDWRVAVK